MTDQVERLSRLLCEKKGIDPDGTGTAISKETKELLGDTYPLWKYQAQFVEAILENL